VTVIELPATDLAYGQKTNSHGVRRHLVFRKVWFWWPYRDQWPEFQSASADQNPPSSSRWCITAFITRLPGTWQTTAFQSLMWRQSTTSSFYQASLPRCASRQPQLVWSSGICCCRPKCLELT